MIQQRYASWLRSSVLLTSLASGLAAQESGTEVSVEFTAPWPPWVTILIVASAAVFTFGLYFREQSPVRNWFRFGMAGLRFTLMCIVLWMMYGYTAQPFRTDLPDLLLFVDTSASMATEDGTSANAETQPKEQQTASTEQPIANAPKSTRLVTAQNILLNDDAQLLRHLESNYQTKLLTIPTERTSNDKDSDPNQQADTSTPPLSAKDATSLVQQVTALNADAEASRLGQQIRQALQQQRGRPVAAVVALTDGITTDGPPLSEIGAEAKQRGIPFHIVGLGSSVPQRDIRLSDLLVDDVVFVNDLVTFDATISANGYKDQTVDVELLSIDDSFAPVTEQITLESDTEVRQIRLSIKADQVGKFDFIVKTMVRDGEASEDNNELRASVDVRDEETRVLLVQSYPSFEYHYLKTLFERTNPDAVNGPSGNSSVKLSVVLQEADPQFSEIDASVLSSFPSREELFQYDIVVFGDVNPSYLGNEAMIALRDFVVERGRGFVGIAGAKYMPSQYADTPLAEILPFDIRSSLSPSADLPIEQGFQPRITPLGRRMPSMQLSLQAETNERIWSELPEQYWLLEVDDLKPGVRVLAEHPTRENTSGVPLPVITLSYTGAGKVLFQNTDESWRWRIGRGDHYFARYWQQTLRYLSRFKLGEGRNVELTSDRETYTRGELVRLRVRYFDERQAPSDQVVVLVEQTGRGQRRIVLTPEGADRGIFSSDVTNLGSGKYHAWVSEPATSGEAPSVDFEVTTPNTERSRLEVDLADMQQAATASGGKFYTAATARDLIDHLPVGKQVRIEPLPPEPLWNTWKIAVLFLALLLTEWLSRRRAGLV